MATEWDSHIDEETMEKYALDSLTAKSAARVEGHLLVCGQCRHVLTSTEAYVSAMRKAAGKLRRAGKIAAAGKSKTEAKS